MNPAKPIVSVNICMYNGAQYIEETLRSVFAQTFQDFEIIIVDDGSTDGSPELIERAFPDPRVTIVRQRHLTLRLARSMALAHSKGDYIAFLDSDDLWMPSKLEQLVAAAKSAPDAGLIFSDCDLIDAPGRMTGRRFSTQFDYLAMDLRGNHGHLELLRRGNFIASPAPIARTSVLRALGGFNESFRHVNDYEMWLRIARRHRLMFVNEVLAQYRVHDSQFTQRRPDVTLPEQCDLLRPIYRSSTYPREIRTAVGDMLLGQHRWAIETALRQRRYSLAVRALFGMCRYPDRLRDSVHHRLAQSIAGRPLEAAIVAFLEIRDLMARARAQAVNLGRQIRVRGVNLLRKIDQRVRPAPPPSATDVWIDGTVLGRAQTGYFSLLSELIRRLAVSESPRSTVHVMTDKPGRAALLARLGPDAARLTFHGIGWRAMHWSHVHTLLGAWQFQLLLALTWIALLAVAPLIAAGLFVAQAAWLIDELASSVAERVERPRLQWSARLIRFLWRRFPAPRFRAPTPNTVEILFWRGRFKWRDSHRIAVIQDMTTRTHPELHTPGNVAEFDEFLGYVQRHAHAITTVSENSRRDIIDRIAVCPDAISVMPMPIHPQFVDPKFSAGIVALHRITTPYLLAVGTIEPRKNLRRLIRAFELVMDEDPFKDLVLVLVGPPGWDNGFRDVLLQTDAAPRVKLAGYVPLEHLPSLYHFASAVICPSVYEGFGIPVMEAMCSSAVVLASRVSSLPEVLGSDGIMFDPYDSADIARALLGTLSMTPAESANYRRRCRRRAEDHLERLAHENYVRSTDDQSHGR